MDIRVTPREEDVGLAFNQARPKSAASWGAIMAGSLVAIAMSLVLMTLGAGLGLASMSPWPNHGPSAGAFTVAAAIWLIVTQWVCSIFGGYITGRLRTRWIGTHEHEIFFRDTANGLVTWALSTVVVAILAASFVSSSVGVGAKSTLGAVASGTVAADTGVSATGAQERLTQPPDTADAAATKVSDADRARKDAAEVAIYTALAMLIGAFIASASAALGGRLRDEHL
jgi:hypothetical protein